MCNPYLFPLALPPKAGSLTSGRRISGAVKPDVTAVLARRGIQPLEEGPGIFLP